MFSARLVRRPLWKPRLRTKLLAGFSVLAVLASALGVHSLFALERVEHSQQRLFQDSLTTTYLLGRYIDQAWAVRTAAVQYLDAQTPDERSAARATLARLDAAVLDLAHQIETIDVGSNGEPRVHRLLDTQAAYLGWRDQALIPAVDIGDDAGARQASMTRGRQLGREWDRAADTYLQQERAEATAIAAQVELEYTRSRAVAAGLLLAAPMLALLIGIRLSRSIARRVSRAAEAAKALARGDLDQSFEAAGASGDEVDDMLAAFQEIVNYLQGMADMAAVADAIVRGEVASDVQPVSERDILGRAFQHMLRSLRRLVAQMQAQAQELGEQAQLLELARDAIIVRDFASGHILFWNRGAEAMYGWERPQAHGKVSHKLLQTEFPDSKDAVDAVLTRTGHWEGELAQRRSDGRRVVVASRQVVQCDALGQPVATLEINTDITARLLAEQAQRHLASIVESSADAIVGIGRDRIIQSWNRGAERLFGHSAEEAIGGPLDRLIPPDRVDETVEVYRRVWSGERIDAFETVRLAQDGRRLEVSLSLSPIKDSKGEIVGVAAILRDVTERRAVERMKDEFVSVVSHELRTPLTSIRGSLGLLAGGVLGELPAKGQRMIDIAVDNTDRLIRLINDILDIERMGSGKVVMQKETCDAAELVLQAVDVMRPMADKSGVVLEAAPHAATLVADPDRLLQMFTNLVSNAIKFSPTGGKVWLTAERRGSEVVFAVRDEGRGIPADKLESIFGRFQQVDASDSRQKGGTGLGLAICRTIAEQHQGRIWAESQFGQGATFWICLPAAEDLCERIAA